MLIFIIIPLARSRFLYVTRHYKGNYLAKISCRNFTLVIDDIFDIVNASPPFLGGGEYLRTLQSKKKKSLVSVKILNTYFSLNDNQKGLHALFCWI